MVVYVFFGKFLGGKLLGALRLRVFRVQGF